MAKKKRPHSATTKATTTRRKLSGKSARVAQTKTIGIGGHLAMPPLPHHRAYGSVPRRFGWMSVHRVSNRGSPSELK